MGVGGDDGSPCDEPLSQGLKVWGKMEQQAREGGKEQRHDSMLVTHLYHESLDHPVEYHIVVVAVAR